MVIGAVLIAVLTLLLSAASVVNRSKRKQWDKEQVVHLPFVLAGFGMACGLILSVPAVVCALDRDWLFLLFAVVCLVCDCMMLAYNNCVIRYDAEGFTARNFWGCSFLCGYGEVEGIRSGKDTRVYFKGHWVMIDQISIGDYGFLRALEKGYRKATGKRLPEIRRRLDPMNGHLDYPWLYFSLYAFVGLVAVAAPVFAGMSIYAEPDLTGDPVYTVSFSNWKVNDGTLYLYSGEDSYKLQFYKEYGNAIPTPEQLCSGEQYRVCTSGEGRYIETLTGEDGKEYITKELERQIYRKTQAPAFWVFVVCAPLGVAFSCFGILVARHPERYSEKFIRLFYKEGTLI